MTTRFLPASLLAWGVATPALACSICHSPTAMGLRHLLFEHDFMVNAAAIAAPIPILLAAILLMAREPRSEPRKAAP